MILHIILHAFWIIPQVIFSFCNDKLLVKCQTGFWVDRSSVKIEACRLKVYITAVLKVEDDALMTKIVLEFLDASWTQFFFWAIEHLKTFMGFLDGNVSQKD